MVGRFSRHFYPFVVLIVIGAIAFSYSHARARLDRLQQHVEARVASAALIPKIRLDAVAANVQLLADNLPMRELAQGDSGARARVESLFVTVMAANAQYAQARWIDGSGFERLSVIRQGGVPKVVAGRRLEPADEPWFPPPTAKLAADEIYVSALHESRTASAEASIGPVWSVTRSLVGIDSENRGFITIDYPARALSHRIVQLMNDVPCELSLLEANGNRLSLTPSSAPGSLTALTERGSELWTQLRQKAAGHYASRGELWFWSSAVSDAADIHPWNADNSSRAMIVAHVTAAQAQAVWMAPLKKTAVASLSLILLFALVAWRLMQSEMAREAASRRAVEVEGDLRTQRAERRFEQQRIEAERLLHREQNELRLAAERASRDWRDLAESMPQLIWTCDAEGLCDYLSPQWGRYTGLPAGQQPGYRWLDQIHPDDREELERAWKAAVRSRGSFDVEFRIRGGDGRYRWFKARAVPVSHAGQALRWYGSNTDIEDLKQSERRLIASESRFRSIYDTAPISIWELEWSAVLSALRELRQEQPGDWAAYFESNPEVVRALLSKIVALDANVRTLEVFAAPAKQALIDALPSLCDTGELLKAFMQHLLAIQRRASVLTVETSLRKLNGEVMNVLLSTSVPDIDGSETRVFASLIDITEKQRNASELELHRHHLARLVDERTSELRSTTIALQEAGERLRESKARFRSAFESTAIGMAVIGYDGRFLQVNSALSSLLGYPATELSGMRLAGICHADDRRYAELAVQTLLSDSGGVFQHELRCLDREGRAVWILLTCSAVEGRRDPAHYFIAQIQDISASKRAVQALKASENFLRTVADGLPGMIGYWDSDLRCRFANGAYRTWFGREPQQLIGAGLADLLGPRLYELNRPYIEGALAGKAQQFERQLTRADGTCSHVWAHYIPDVRDGRVCGFFVLISDITELKQTQIALVEANQALLLRTEQAEAASLAKSLFLANMSHEVRTPINAVMGMAHLLSATPLQPKQRGYVQKIRGASRALLGVLNDVLDYSKIESGKMQVECIDFALDQVLEEVADLFFVAAHEKGLDFHLDVAPDVPQNLLGDPLRIRQVIANLVGNAIKFTERGRVVVRVRVHAPAAPSATLECSVEDTGIGIDAEHQRLLFQPFVQADSSTTRRHGGSGLGLAICKRLVELMDGEIELRSDHGEGSCFRMRIPLRRGSEHCAPPVLTLSGQRILILDDDPISRSIMSAQLLHWNAEVETRTGAAPAPSQASATAERAACADVIILSVDGADFSRFGLLEDVLSRCRGQDLALPLLIVITSDPEVLRSRMSRCWPGDLVLLLKPVTSSRLAKALTRMEADGCIRHDSSLSDMCTDLDALVGARVLLVENDPANQQVAVELLTGLSLEVEVATSAEDALAKFERNVHDLVLMDIQMAGIAGFDPIRRLRVDDHHAAVPIVAMAAAVQEDERSAANAAGVDDYLPRPLDAASLIAVLKRWLPTQSTGGRVVRLETKAGPSRDGASSPACLDLELALHRLGGNRLLLQRMLQRFVADFGRVVVTIRQSLARGDLAMVSRTLHALKWSAGTIGAVEVEAIVARYEIDLGAGRQPELQPLVGAIRRALSVVSAELRSESESESDATANPAPDGSLREVLEQLKSLLDEDRAVPSTLIDHLRALAKRANETDVLGLLDAVENFDYVVARDRLDAVRRNLA